MELASTPDDASDVERQLVELARLAAEHLSAVSYASTTVLREDSYTTVAATHPLAAALDDAQYADRTGPCLEALDSATPVAVRDVAMTMRWPGFRRVARRIGLQSSLSIPLFAGSGHAFASMNLYGRDRTAMTDLTGHVRAAFGSAGSTPHASSTEQPASGAGDLATGVVKALAVRDQIQRAIGMLVSRQGCSAHEAYLSLRVRAADAGVPLPAMAIRTVKRLV
ncbi:GAF and ANTAR domain-containing protein [Cryptosporangium aurantiacum]|uniref:GAF domain-containing protein n=1 Tax=Cryptosporangium aurantiacum TaxID=134849 RepID=A0A1M7PC02_9ACTN|nr:GAF and ANTAR domain-containing protein [Cryptosporangium aurantiacum]SHN14389.1 GAF domain-containing protein [Cryptosporangium aurantiacum]